MFRWLRHLITDTNLLLMSDNLQKVTVVRGQLPGLQSYCLFHRESAGSDKLSTVIDMHFELKDVEAGDILEVHGRQYRVVSVTARNDSLKLDLVDQDAVERNI